MPRASLRPCAYPGCTNLVSYGRCEKHRHDFDYYPKMHKPIPLNVFMVVGPPGSGKNTFVESHKNEFDILIDLDIIKSEIGGLPKYSHFTKDIVDRSIQKRNSIIERMQNIQNSGQQLWFLIGAPDRADREKWKTILRPVCVYVISCPLEICFRRIEARNIPTEGELKKAAERWFQDYEPIPGEIIINSAEE
ncbi:MAG TPA: AAA family ATPase [Anaerolineales bacterium]